MEDYLIYDLVHVLEYLSTQLNHDLFDTLKNDKNDFYFDHEISVLMEYDIFEFEK